MAQSSIARHFNDIKACPASARDVADAGSHSFVNPATDGGGMQGVKFMKKFAFAASALGAMIMAGSAQAATYVGTRTVVDTFSGFVSNVNLSITTDGTIGTLARSNSTDWTVGVTGHGGSDTLFGPLSGNNRDRKSVV